MTDCEYVSVQPPDHTPECKRPVVGQPYELDVEDCERCANLLARVRAVYAEIMEERS